MVIASIDLMDGKAVQLVQGDRQRKVLERDDPVGLAKEFNRFGEVAVIDLDAALGRTGETGASNKKIIREICRHARCRVGGGIRTLQQAKEWASFGAEKLIIGSSAFKNNRINIPFLESLAAAVGRERIMVAVDARDREIVTHGWKTRTGLDLLETAPKLEPYVSELLFTCVEQEGRMQGIDMETVRALRKIFKKPLTAAGGVQSLEEIETLAGMGVDVQLGMALYTGKIRLEDAFVRSLDWKTPLLPVITTDSSGQVLMLAYASRESLTRTFETGKMHYWSRSRQKLWMKGETSGNIQHWRSFRVDCDRDALLAEVEQTGPACHLENYSCFGPQRFGLDRLYRVIADRFANPTPGSYTATLDRAEVREKLLEEAQEVVEAENRDDVIWEAADVLYFLLVLMQKEGVTVDDVLAELCRRRKK